MPAREVTAWAVFEQEFGPLTMHERADALTAQITWAVFAAHGGKGRMSDYVPQWAGPARWESDTEWLSILAARPGGL